MTISVDDKRHGQETRLYPYASGRRPTDVAKDSTIKEFGRVTFACPYLDVFWLASILNHLFATDNQVSPMMPRIDEVIGSRLRAKREELQLAPSSLAQHLKMSLADLEAIEGGNKRMRARDLSDIADILGVKLSFFFRS